MLKGLLNLLIATFKGYNMAVLYVNWLYNFLMYLYIFCIFLYFWYISNYTVYSFQIAVQYTIHLITMCRMKLCHFPLCSKIVSVSCQQFLYCWTYVSQMYLSLLLLRKTFSFPLNTTSCCPADCFCDSTISFRWFG